MKVLQNRKQLGVLIFVLIAIVLFYLFSSQSISTIKEEEEEPSEPQDFSNKPYDIFYTHSIFQKQHERWSVHAQGYQFIRFSEAGQEEYKTGKLTIEYKGDRLPKGPFTAKVETLSGSVTHNYDQPLDERKITFFSLDHLGHRGSAKPVTVTLEWKDNKDVLKLDGSVQSFHEHHIKDPISLDEVEVPALEEIVESDGKHKTGVQNGDFKVKFSSTLLLFSPYQNDEKKTPLTLKLPTDSMTIPFSFHVDNLKEGNDLSVYYRNEFGNIIEIWNKEIEHEDLKNNSISVTQSVPFKHFGRKQIWAEVDGNEVGKVGLSLRPKIPSE